MESGLDRLSPSQMSAERRRAKVGMLKKTLLFSMAVWVLMLAPCIPAAGSVQVNGGRATFITARMIVGTRCMALNLAPFHIRVNCICPGYILTPAFTSYVAEMGADFDEVEKELSKQTILNRLGRPEEIANCVVFLVF